MTEIRVVSAGNVLSSVVVACGLLLGGCAAPVGAARVAPDSGQQCAEQCAAIGMELSAVAIMANNVGCVCLEKSTASAPPDVEHHASSTAGGMAAVLMRQQAEQDRQHQANQFY